MVQKPVIALAASLAIVFCPGSEENQKKYAENDTRFKESPLLKKLLEQTKLNKEKNRQQILDKYSVRGAECGVGHCSADAMSPEERDRFISSQKQKAGME